MRARLLTAIAALSVLVGACGTVPSSSAAVVGDDEVSMEQFTTLVTTRLDQVGVDGDDLPIAQQAQDLGLLDVEVLVGAVQQALSDGTMAQDDLPVPPPEVLDRAFTAQRDALGDGYDAALQELGLSEDDWHAVHDRVVPRIIAGFILFNQLGQQPPTPFPLADEGYVGAVQTYSLTELVRVEIVRWRFEQLDLALNPDDVEAQYETVKAGFQDEAAFQRALQQAGYADDSLFRDLQIRHSLRQQALQEPDNAEALAELEDAEVTVAQRFGSWDASQGRVVAPETGA